MTAILKAIICGLVLALFCISPAKSQYALEGTRKPMYAGSWYESDGDKLKTELEDYLAKADPVVDGHAAARLKAANQPLSKPVMALIVPHAGYAFSGRAAAYAYKAARVQDVKRVFLLGPSHYVAFRGAALPMAVSFATPLGDLEVDYDTVAELKDYPLFQRLPEAHKVEHSLEMQLPYIKQCFGDAKIVPVVIGSLQDDTEVRLVASILRGYLKEGDLVVVSSDFTHHGPRYDYQPFKENVRENIAKLDSQAFKYLSALDLDGFLKFQQETKDSICGFYPCAVLAAMLPEASKATLLQYYTSQDTTVEDTDNSVSYLSIAYSGTNWTEGPAAPQKATDLINLTKADQDGLLKLARSTVELYVREKRVPTPQELGVTVTPAMRQVLGAFVTLNKIPRPGGPAPNPAAMHAGKELRGCIGHIWPLKPVFQSVIDNAVSACSRDNRFNSVQTDELNDIRIEISILTPPRRIGSYSDIVLGRDGIVFFKDGHQSVFLPYVPGEFGWDLPQTLTQLSKKAQLQPDDWRYGAKFDVFQSYGFEENRKL